MRSSGGEEYAELTEYGPRFPGGGTPAWAPRGRRPEAAEEALLAGRTGLYYSPPGTSYTIVERPSSALQQHPPVGSAQQGGYGAPRGTYLGSFTPTPGSRGGVNLVGSGGKKRPISPEQVLRLFGSTGGHSSAATTGGKLPERRSPASSPPSAAHRPQPPLYPPPPPINPLELTTRTVTMVREAQDTHGFGICVKGGKEAGIGVFISRIEEGSVAERVGLRPGDSILEVNGTPFTAISHEEALKMLKSCRKLSMTVRSPGGMANTGACPGGTWQMWQTCSWMDRHGRPVSPPLEYTARSVPAPTPRFPYGRPSSKDRSIRRVDLCIEPGQSLGLMIRGGAEYNLGIFITGVDKDSVADRAGLMVGDQILEVNGQSFMDVSHDEAVAQLKYHKRMSLLVKDVGKVPHSCTAYDRDWDLCSPGSRVAQTTRKWAAALQMVEEKARCLLSRPEFTALCYYTDEYAAKHMTIEAFVQVISELLNSSDKYTLMTELREIVALEDRNKFDELVYRRNLESGRVKDTMEQDYNHSLRKGMPMTDTNHTMYPGYHEDCVLYKADAYRSPSEDSGLGMGIGERTHRHRPASAAGKKVTDLNDEDPQTQEYVSGDEENTTGDNRNRRHSSPGQSRTGSTTALHQQDYPDSSGYLGGLRSSLGGWTQKVKSWYWGRPLELAQKLSRSFDMKDEQALAEGEGAMRRHQSMQGLARGDGAGGAGCGASDGPREPPRVTQDPEGNLRVLVRKTRPILGIAIEGGANTKHPLPRIININENGAAYHCGGLEVGQLILQVDGARVDGLQHQDVARLIAESFARRDRPDIEFTVVEAKRSNMEPKPTALVFLEA